MIIIWIMFLQAHADNSRICVESTHASINFVGFQLVSLDLIVGSPCLRFGLLDEGSYGWKHGFELSVGYDI